MNTEFSRFLLVGGFAATINFLSRPVYEFWVSYVPAVTLAYLTGFVVAFLLNRVWVFEASGRAWTSELAWFAVVNLLGLSLTVFISWMLARHLLIWLGLPAGELTNTLAHLIGIASPVLTSYLGHRHLSFRKERPV